MKFKGLDRETWRFIANSAKTFPRKRRAIEKWYKLKSHLANHEVTTRNKELAKYANDVYTRMGQLKNIYKKQKSLVKNSKVNRNTENL